MINKIIWIIGIVWIGNIQDGVQAQRRNFIHPRESPIPKVI